MNAEIVRHPSCPQPPAELQEAGVIHLIVAGFCPGIYFLCEDGVVVYVGQSNKVIRRVADHLAQNEQAYYHKKFDAASVYFIPCPLEQLKEMELYWIQKLKPKYNVTGKGEGRPERREPPPLPQLPQLPITPPPLRIA